MNRLIASYIINGSTRGESHGGICLIDPERRTTHRCIDWNLPTISWREYEGDRGLRGLAIDGDTLYVASSHELLAFSKDFQLRKSWRHPYLRNCQDICIWQRSLFVVSAGCDCILAFDLDQGRFHWAMHVSRKEFQFIPRMFEPDASDGPLMLDKLHLNSVYCDANGMYLSGSKTGGMLHFSGQKMYMAAELPPGARNARPFRAGVLFNDSQAGVVRYCGRNDMKEDRALAIPSSNQSPLDQRDSNTTAGNSNSNGRGLCLLSDRVVAGGATPATVSLYNLAENRQLVSIVLTQDAQHSIHSLAVWPFD
jgi:hypothetical protein